MTVQQAIEKANDYRAGNAVPDEMKLAWLNDIEAQIYDDVIRTHLHDFRYSKWWYMEDGKWKFKPCPVYTEDTTDTELIAEHPYDLLYVWYLVAQIDLISQEMTLYNASAALHNSYMQRYKNKYHNEHRPVPTPKIKVGAFR